MPSAEEGIVGEVSIQVDLSTHPGTGNHNITVKGESVSPPLLYYSIVLFCCGIILKLKRVVGVGVEEYSVTFSEFRHPEFQKQQFLFAMQSVIPNKTNFYHRESGRKPLFIKF